MDMTKKDAHYGEFYEVNQDDFLKMLHCFPSFGFEWDAFEKNRQVYISRTLSKAERLAYRSEKAFPSDIGILGLADDRSYMISASLGYEAGTIFLPSEARLTKKSKMGSATTYSTDGAKARQLRGIGKEAERKYGVRDGDVVGDAIVKLGVLEDFEAEMGWELKPVLKALREGRGNPCLRYDADRGGWMMSDKDKLTEFMWKIEKERKGWGE